MDIHSWNPGLFVSLVYVYLICSRALLIVFYSLNYQLSQAVQSCLTVSFGEEGRGREKEMNPYLRATVVQIIHHLL